MEQSNSEKLISVQLVKNLHTFLEPDGSVSCSQEPATGPYPELNAFHTLAPRFLRSISMLSSHLHFCVPSSLVLSVLWQILY
jgi:hypothetical protein